MKNDYLLFDRSFFCFVLFYLTNFFSNLSTTKGVDCPSLANRSFVEKKTKSICFVSITPSPFLFIQLPSKKNEKFWVKNVEWFTRSIDFIVSIPLPYFQPLDPRQRSPKNRIRRLHKKTNHKITDIDTKKREITNWFNKSTFCYKFLLKSTSFFSV